MQASSIMQNIIFSGEAATFCLIKDRRGRIIVRVDAAEKTKNPAQSDGPI